jgi:hypothetical protein
MTACERLRAEAAGLAALPPDDPERAAAAAHAEGCPECARALRQAERLQAMLETLEPSALPVGALARAAQAIEDELIRERRRRSGWAALAAAAVTAVLAGVAHHRVGSGIDWGLAVALAVAGVALSAVSVRRPLAALGGAAVAAAAVVLLGGRQGGFETGLAFHAGLECLLTELASAGVVLWAGWMALRGGTTRPARAAVAAAAAAGALAGAAALQITCPAHTLGLHLLVYHAGGVVLAALAASALVRRPRRVPAA